MTRELFTEEDQKRLGLLPVTEQNVFYTRFADIAMRNRIADDEWDHKKDLLLKEVDQLIVDIHKRLDDLAKFNECGGIGTEPYHPNRKDFEDAYAKTNPKVQDRQRPAVILETGKEGKGEKR